MATTLELSQSFPDDNLKITVFLSPVQRFPGDEVSDVDRPFKLRRTVAGAHLEGFENIVAWLRSKLRSEGGDGNLSANFSAVLVRMVTDAVTQTWPRADAILATVVSCMTDSGGDDDDEDQSAAAGPKPASKAAVEALERVFVADGGECSICLKEFGKKTVALRMPCSHVFHRRCLVEWLNRASTCPMCRFQMPSNCWCRRCS